MSRWIESTMDSIEKMIPDILADLGRLHLRQLNPSTIALKKGVHRRDVYTQDDRAAEGYLRDRLKGRYPEIGFLGEEFSPSPPAAAKTFWVIDAIDGTLNYSQGLPHFATSVALVHHDEVLYGCIYDSVRHEVFRCRKGRGVYLGATRLENLKRCEIADALIAIGHGYDDEKAKIVMGAVRRLQGHVRGIRQTGCASLDLAYVAAGRLGCFLHPYLKPWDRSAGELMVREVAGRIIEVAELKTVDTQAIVAGNEWVVDVAVQALMAELPCSPR